MADGSALEVEVKHSKECVPPLVEENEKIRLAAAAAVERRQQRWIQKVEDAGTHPPSERPSKSMRKRAARKAKADETKARLRLLEEKEAAAARQREERLQGLMRQALEHISALAKAAATSDTNKRVVARHAALKQGGEQLMPVDVLADTAGAACSDDELGEKLRKALDGLPDERLGAALENLVGTDLFAPSADALSGPPHIAS